MPSIQPLSKPNTLKRPASPLRAASPLSAEYYENKLRAVYTAAITDNQDTKFTSDVLLGIDKSNPSLPPVPKIKIPLSEAKIEMKRKRQEKKMPH